MRRGSRGLIMFGGGRLAVKLPADGGATGRAAGSRTVPDGPG